MLYNCYALDAIYLVYTDSQFVSRSLDDVKNEEWLIEVGSAMGEKERVLERYMNYPEEKVYISTQAGALRSQLISCCQWSEMSMAH